MSIGCRRTLSRCASRSRQQPRGADFLRRLICQNSLSSIFLDGPPPGRNNAGIALGICGLPPGQARRFSKALSEGLTGDMDPRYGRCTLTLEIKIRHRIPTLIGNRLRFSGLAQSRSDRPLPLNKHPRQLLSPFDGQSMGGARRDYVQIQSQRSDSKQDPTGSSMRPLAMYQGTGLTIFNYAQR